MRSYHSIPAATFLLLVAGCSSGPEEGAAAGEQTTSTTTTTPSLAPGASAISPDGVTTAVNQPAESTEDEYFEACLAAKTWMAEQGGDPRSQIEPYLATIQMSDAAGPGTFGNPWSELAPARQSAIIVAVEAAADDLCG